MSKLFLSLVALLFSYCLIGQQISPYSRFGPGDVNTQNFAASKALGGISAAYSSPLNLNFNNPASYGALSFVSLETAIRFNTSSLTSGDTTYTSGDGFIDYIALGLPLTPNRTGRVRVGASVGLVPFSQMNYNLSQSITDANNITFERSFFGSGRLYDLYGGVGVQIAGRGLLLLGTTETGYRDTLIGLNKIKVGLNAGYRFGNLSYGEVLLLEEVNGVLNSRKNSNLRVNDLVLTPGIQYEIVLNRGKLSNIGDSLVARNLTWDLDSIMMKRLIFTVGASASVPMNFNATFEQVYDRFLVASGQAVTVDTVIEPAASSVDMAFPTSISLGATLGNQVRWLVGFDVKYTTWSGYNSPVNTTQLRDNVRLGLGVELTPRITSKSVIRRSSYRLGGFYDTGKLELNGQGISEFGITFGIGIPLVKDWAKAVYSGSSYINVSFEAGSRGTTAGNLIKETYFGGTVGILLNDKWFQKRKYD